jgi:hypothetical protein
MDGPVDLHRQLRLVTVEVENERADRMLATELPRPLAVAKRLPEHRLARGEGPPKLPRCRDVALVPAPVVHLSGFYGPHQPALTPPLSQRERGAQRILWKYGLLRGTTDEV